MAVDPVCARALVHCESEKIEEYFDETFSSSCVPESSIPSNCKNSKGRSLLMASIIHLRMDIFQELLQNGPDLHEKDIEGNTCLHLAAMNGFHEFIAYLPMNEERNNEGKNPMDLALRSESDETVRIVFELGILPSVPHQSLFLNALVLSEIKIALDRKKHDRLPSLLTICSSYDIEQLINIAVTESSIEQLELLIPFCNVSLDLFEDIVKMKNSSLLIMILGEERWNQRKAYYECIWNGMEFSILQENYEAVLHLIKTDFTVEHVYLAIQSSSDEIIALLLDNDFDLEAVEDSGMTAFIMAAKYQRCSILKSLKHRGASIYASDSKGNTALHYAAINGSLEVIQLLIGWKFPLYALNRNGQTAFNVGCSRAREYLSQFYEPDLISKSEIKYLLQNSSLKVLNEDQCETILFSFLKRQDYETAKLLFTENESNWNTFENKIRNIHALYSNLDKRTIEYFQFLLNEYPLHRAIEEDNFEYFAFILQDCAQDLLLKSNESGYFPLHVAVLNRNVNFVKLVLEVSPINIQARNGKTALYLATDKEDTEIFNCLLECGASVLARVSDGTTALHIASIRGNLFMVKKLIDAGANVVAKSYPPFSQIPIDSAFNEKVFEFIRKEMNKQGIDKVKDAFDRNCLEEIVLLKMQFRLTVEDLLGQFGSINHFFEIYDCRLNTIMHYAVKYQVKDLIDCILTESFTLLHNLNGFTVVDFDRQLGFDRLSALNHNLNSNLISNDLLQISDSEITSLLHEFNYFDSSERKEKRF